MQIMLVKWIQFLFGLGIVVFFFLPWIETGFVLPGLGRLGNSLSGFDIFMQTFCNPTRARCSDNHESLWLIMAGPVSILAGIVLFSRFGMPLWYRFPSVVLNAAVPVLFVIYITRQEQEGNVRVAPESLTVWLALLLVCCLFFLVVPRQRNRAKKLGMV